MSRTTTRIVLIITELYVGGAEKCLVKLARNLFAHQFEPIVYSLAARPEPGRDQLCDELEQTGILVRYLGSRSIFASPVVFLRLLCALRRDRPALVQSFLFHANVLSVLACRLGRIGPVVTGVRVADPRRWRRVEAWLTPWTARVACVSESVARFVRSQGFPAEKLIVIPNAIEAEQICRDDPAHTPVTDGQIAAPRSRVVPGEERCKVIFVGRLDHQKGIDLLIRAWQQLAASFPDHDLMLVGEGPQRTKIEQQVASLGLSHRVSLLGWRPDVPELLRRSELFVLPSRWEGMPNALLEAMAQGLPVVATNVEGVREVLGDAGGAQLVPAESVEALANQIARILAAPALARQLGEQNQRRVASQFSVSRMVDGYVGVYREVLS